MGSLVGLALDLTIRAQTKGTKSLDDVMRALWQRFGRDFYGSLEGAGVTEQDVEALFDEVTGLSLKRTLNRFVHGKDDLPLEKLLARFGVSMPDQQKNAKPALSVRTVKDGNDCKLANVYEGGPAHRAGLSAGDVLAAIDGLRVTANNLDTLLGRYRIGDKITIHAFRRDELFSVDAVLKTDDAPQLSLKSEAKPAAAARLRATWLGQ